MDWACSTNEEDRNAYNALVWKPERRPSRRLEDDIKTNIQGNSMGRCGLH